MTWSAALRLPTITALTLLVVAFPLMLGAQVSDAIQVLVSLVMTGSLVAVLVILATGAEADLREGGGEHLVEQLSPSRVSSRLETLVGLILGVLANAYFSSLFLSNPMESLKLLDSQYYETTAAGSIWLEWLVMVSLLFTGVLVVHVISFSRRQIQLFSHWADEFNVDLMHTDECQVFTLQPMRYLLITVIYTSLNIIVYQILSAFDMGEQALQGQIPLVVLMMFCCLPFIYPVSVIRDRVAAVKQQEIESVRAALTGNRASLEKSQIAHISHEFSAPDLMMYEQYVKDIWEWPIQGYVQRLLLYVLLPPLAWVLAALVEQIVEAYVS